MGLISQSMKSCKSEFRLGLAVSGLYIKYNQINIVYNNVELLYGGYYYVTQTKFGRHIVFAPFLLLIIIIIILLLLSFFLPPKVYLTHFSATTEQNSMKLHRNVKHYE